MKRILVVLAIVAAAAFVGASAGGATAAPLPPVTDFIQFCHTDLGAPYITNGVTEEESDCESSDANLANPALQAAGYVHLMCIEGHTYLFADDDLASSFVIDLKNLGYSAALGACATAPQPQVNNVFLCYSTFSNVPAVFPAPVAAALLKAGGYWTPYAVPGAADGGTNIGGYHLVCNLASGQAAGSNTLGGAGEVDGANTKPDVTNVAGYYPIIGG